MGVDHHYIRPIMYVYIYNYIEMVFLMCARKTMTCIGHVLNLLPVSHLGICLPYLPCLSEIRNEQRAVIMSDHLYTILYAFIIIRFLDLFSYSNVVAYTHEFCLHHLSEYYFTVL